MSGCNLKSLVMVVLMALAFTLSSGLVSPSPVAAAGNPPDLKGCPSGIERAVPQTLRIIVPLEGCTAPAGGCPPH